MSQHSRIAGFELPHALDAHKLHRILASTLEARGLSGNPEYYMMRPQAEDPLLYWDAAYFNLDRVRMFSESTPDEQYAILNLTNQGLLQEAYCIEKAGMGYMSRMVLLAESTEERMLYTLFAAEETTHFVQLCPFLTDEPSDYCHPFLQLLSELVEQEDKTLLLFILQVVLEGWGMTHYRNLARGCQDPALSHTLNSFLRDEARHHATGVTLFNQATVSAASHAAIVEILAQFLHMVQIGPLGVVDAIAQIKGPLSPHQRSQILDELDAKTHSSVRLHLLRSLMQKGNGGAIVRHLEERGAFELL